MQTFSVNWHHLTSHNLLSVSVYMDGVLVHHHVSLPGSDGGHLCSVISGVKSTRPFIFSNVPRLRKFLAYVLSTGTKIFI